MSPPAPAASSLLGLGISPLAYMENDASCVEALSTVHPEVIRDLSSTAQHVGVATRRVPDPAAHALAAIAAVLQGNAPPVATPEHFLRLQQAYERPSRFPLLLVETARAWSRVHPHRAVAMQRRVLAYLDLPDCAGAAYPSALELARVLAPFDLKIAQIVVERQAPGAAGPRRPFSGLIDLFSSVIHRSGTDRVAVALRTVHLIELTHGLAEATRVLWQTVRAAGTDVADEMLATALHVLGRRLIELGAGRRAVRALRAAHKVTQRLPVQLSDHAKALAYHRDLADRMVDPAKRPGSQVAVDRRARTTDPWSVRLEMARRARARGQALQRFDDKEARISLAYAFRALMALSQPWEALATFIELTFTTPSPRM
ncbi:MAG: hypothetical protein AAF772_05325, partial [Acidobacteriota bacterium]